MDTLAERDMGMNKDDERTITDLLLLVDQIEFANVLILNKTYLVETEALKQLEALLHRMNPNARLIQSSYGRVPLTEVLNTGRFDFDQASAFDEWLSGEAHTPETEEYGVSSFVYRARRPFHPQRLMVMLESDALDAVIRSKGFVWLATRHHLVGVWSQAGEMLSLDYGGDWWVTVPEHEFPNDPVLVAEIKQQFEGTFGDRRQELVIIGIDLQREAIIQAFDNCLLTDTEMALAWEQWHAFDDPFTLWIEDEIEEETH